MKKLNWNVIRFFLMLFIVLGLYAFSSSRNDKRIVSAPEVEFIDGDKLFITRDSVNKLLIENFRGRKTITKEKLDLKKLESSVDSHPMIEDAEVYVSIDGTLKAKVKQKTPMARVINDLEVYYIDFQGTKMPISNYYSARVPLVTGDLTVVPQDQLADFLRYIYNDKFLSKNIIAVNVHQNQAISMKTRTYDYTIDFGKILNVESKFNNYKAFYQKAINDSLIDNYSLVNLKFSKQVVCTKR